MNALRGFQQLGMRLAAATALGLPLFAAGAAYASTPPASSAPIDPQNDFGADIQGDVPGASALEGRLMAPCCWTQTIDIHDSEIALSMRHEVRRRLRNGESAEAIQASFVQRYGPKILAVQPNSPLKGVFVGLSVVMAGAGVASVLMIGRWRKRSTSTEPPETKRSEARDQWDDKLDAELKDLDDE
ncbi:MAG TPA: cytochrome c-type biogenesis protein CcmH [Polyangiaceae bacterium]|jgi:cytochrome c-type biogenesis protein CcmH|nr:cytochrome c-type biogenesis protein CcmH [Polyangiaceae bacterium]